MLGWKKIKGFELILKGKQKGDIVKATSPLVYLTQGSQKIDLGLRIAWGIGPCLCHLLLPAPRWKAWRGSLNLDPRRILRSFLLWSHHRPFRSWQKNTMLLPLSHTLFRVGHNFKTCLLFAGFSANSYKIFLEKLKRIMFLLTHITLKYKGLLLISAGKKLIIVSLGCFYPGYRLQPESRHLISLL